MFDDDLFPFVDPIVETIEEKPFSFTTWISSFFDRHIKKYFALNEAEHKKNLDMEIGLTLIGERGREKLFERARILRESKRLK